MHKFDIQLFAGTAFVVDDVLPATTDLKIAWTEDVASDFETATPLVKTNSDGFILIGYSDICDPDPMFGDPENCGYYIEPAINGIQITEGLDGFGSTMISQNGTIDTSGWSLAKRTISSVSAGVATVGLTYEDLNASAGGTNNLSFGSTAVSKMTVGSTEVSKVYFGSTLVYEKST